MPDFLLCNSKLTFQMTMIPDKTNYLTQGPDGVKRLKQGPDLASYRGLSVIHSRAFSMEAGQQPRDILRRRVRTAEYYRIPPSKANLEYEFELYNEERDTWFAMSFKDLLKMAQLGLIDMGGDGDHNELIHRAYERAVRGGTMASLEAAGGADTLLAKRGLGAQFSDTRLSPEEETELANLDMRKNVFFQNSDNAFQVFIDSCIPTARREKRLQLLPAFGMGLKPVFSSRSKVERAFCEAAKTQMNFMPYSQGREHCFVMSDPRVSASDLPGLFRLLHSKPLYKPFTFGLEIAKPGSVDWYKAFAYYMSVYQRRGVCMAFWGIDNSEFRKPPDALLVTLLTPSGGTKSADDVWTKMPNRFDDEDNLRLLHVGCQWQSPIAGYGAVNDPFHLIPCATDLMRTRMSSGEDNPVKCVTFGGFFGRCLLMTWELLEPLMTKYRTVDGDIVTGIQLVQQTGMYGKPNAWEMLAAEVARTMRSFEGKTTNVIPLDEFTVEHTRPLKRAFEVGIEATARALKAVKLNAPLQETLAEYCIDTWPMSMSTMSRPEHNLSSSIEGIRYGEHKHTLDSSYGHLNLKYLRSPLNAPNPELRSRWQLGVPINTVLDGRNRSGQRAWEDTRAEALVDVIEELFNTLSNRIFQRPFVGRPGSDAVGIFGYSYTNSEINFELDQNNLMQYKDQFRQGPHEDIGPNLKDVPLMIAPTSNDDEEGPMIGGAGQGVNLEDVEIVIVRPNIEHSMLGIIMGLGGNELGNTLWGQTELSVYDDSMHGIWGMSYKYHERAIVFNERNLIRLWDVAYDGYNGGKDDTYVDWTDAEDRQPNGFQAFKRLTMDTTKNYRGPSMMVMAFVHRRDSHEFHAHFRRNWPSPIVFHDAWQEGQPGGERVTLPVDCENLQVIDAEEFRVFNSPIYKGYREYFGRMPAFSELHKMRKTAGQSSSEAETPGDSLAFQGTMRIKNRSGGVVQEILGSGHHGADYVGVASVRAGKGTKSQPQAPSLYRMV